MSNFQPGPQDLHVDTLLTNLSIAYQNAEYIADEIFPLVTVNKQSDIVPNYNQSFWFRNEAKPRAPATKSQGGGWTVDLTQKYFCQRYSYRHEIDDQTRDNADAPFNLDREATMFVSDKIQMYREINWANYFFVTGKWGVDKTGGSDFTQWDNYGASTPIQDLQTYADIVEGNTGRMPNKFVLGKQVWTVIRNNPEFLDRIKYTQRAILTEDIFSSVIEIPKILIGRAIYTTAAEGVAESSVTYSRIWGKAAWMGFVPNAPSLLTPAAGYTFVWQRVPSAQQYIKRMRDEEREVDIIEGNTHFDQKITASRAGLFMATAVG